MADKNLMNNIKALRDLLVNIEQEVGQAFSSGSDDLAKLRDLRQLCESQLSLLESQNEGLEDRGKE